MFHSMCSTCAVWAFAALYVHGQTSVHDSRPRLRMDNELRGRAADVFSAKTLHESDAGAMPLFSIDGRVYLVSLGTMKDFKGYRTEAFGSCMWDRGRYQYDKRATFTYSKQSVRGPAGRHVSDASKFLGYSLVACDKRENVVRLVTQDDKGMSHEWLKETVEGHAGKGNFRLRVVEGEFQGWYLSFGAAQEIKEKTEWKDSAGKSGEMPPHTRYPAILVKEPDDRSLLREIGYFPEGK